MEIASIHLLKYRVSRLHSPSTSSFLALVSCESATLEATAYRIMFMCIVSEKGDWFLTTYPHKFNADRWRGCHHYHLLYILFMRAIATK